MPQLTVLFNFYINRPLIPLCSAVSVASLFAQSFCAVGVFIVLFCLFVSTVKRLFVPLFVVAIVLCLCLSQIVYLRRVCTFLCVLKYYNCQKYECDLKFQSITNIIKTSTETKTKKATMQTRILLSISLLLFVLQSLKTISTINDHPN
jgi:uncharacterized membrane protein